MRPSSTTTDDTAWIDAGPPAAPTAGRLIGWLLARQRRSIALGATAGLAWMAAPAAVPAVLGFVVDRGIVGGDGGALAAGIAALLALGALEAGAGAVRHRQACLLHERSQLAATALVAGRALDPRGGLEERMAPGEVLSRATSDARRLGGPADLMCRGTAAVIVFVVVAVVLLSISVELGLVIVLGLPPAVALMLPLWRPLDRRTTAAQEALGEASTTAQDAVAGLGVLRGLGAEGALRARHRRRVARVRASALRLARIDAGWEALLIAVPGALVAAVAWLGGRMALEGQLSAGELVACFGYVVVLVEPIATFGEVGRVWARGLASGRRVVDVIATPPAVADDGASPAGSQARGAAAVELRGVRYAAGEDAVLDGLELAVPAGAQAGVVCAEARAPRLLVALLAREREPDAGAVLVDGVDARERQLDEHRGLVVTSPRTVSLVGGSVREELRRAAPDADDHRLHAALDAAAAGDVLEGEGLDRPVAQRGRALSGGQRQRVALARALLSAAPVLVLEEPTGAVDAVTEQAIARRLRAARDGRTTVVITRSPALLAAQDVVVLVADGVAVAQDTHAALLNDARYRKALGG